MSEQNESHPAARIAEGSFVARVSKVKRRGNTVVGNPRWTFVTGTGTYKVRDNTSYALEIVPSRLEGRLVRFYVNRQGSVIGADVLDEASGS